MKIKQKIEIFLEFVELRTKVASVFPMLAGFLWTYGHFGRLNWLNSALFAVAVLLFDMCTTAINNTMDFHKAVDLDYKTQENVLGKYQLNYRKMVQIVLALLLSSIAVSLFLVGLTDVLLLVLGALCFVVGIGYTYGPMPISRLPLGEVFSGVTMGFGIFYLAIYMTAHEQLLASAWGAGVVGIQFYWLLSLQILWASLPLVCTIAAIMLANNTCDLEVDVRNQRFTLVYYIGKKAAVTLYTVLQLLPWVIWLSLIVLGELPVFALIFAIALLPHWRSIQAFRMKQVKRETFVEAVKSFVLVSGVYCVSLALKLFV